MGIIPKSFEEWQDCIQKKCGIPLTAEFASSRLLVYHDLNDPETIRFVKLYGDEHLQNIRSWLARVSRNR